MLVEGHLKKTPVKLFQNPSTGKGEVVYRIFCFKICSSNRSRFKLFSIYNSGSHLLQRAERFEQFLYRGLPKEHYCEIISKYVNRLSRNRLFFFYLKPWRPFCSTEQNGFNHFGRWSLYSYFEIHALVKEEKSFKSLSIINSGDHLVQRRRMI